MDIGAVFKYFTITTTILSLFLVDFVYLMDSWKYPKNYPRYYSWFFTVFYTWLYIMWTWSYIVTISVKKKPPRTSLVGRSLGRCERCKINKPDRSHHCSTCGYCVEKMDHHCIWTNTCIGYRNYKSFLLFIGYLACGTFTYDYLAFNFFLKNRENIGVALYSLAIVETGIVFLTTLLANSLLIAHIMMASINLSTLEYMKGSSFKYFWTDENDSKNIYDMGTIQNLIQIFGDNPIMWGIPTIVNERESGCFFPVKPEAKQISSFKTVVS